MGLGISPKRGNEELFENNFSYENSNITQIIIITISSIVLFVSLVSVFFLFSSNRGSNNYYDNNISLEGMKISSYSKEELKNILEQTYNRRYEEKAVFHFDNYEQKVSGNDIGIKYDISKTMDDLEKARKRKDKKKEEMVIISMTYDSGKLNNVYNDAISIFKNERPEYEIDSKNNEVLVNKNIENNTIDEKDYKKIVLDKFRENNFDQVTKIPVHNIIMPDVDIEKIYTTITKPAKNASVVNGMYIKEENGIKFVKTLDEMKQEYSNASNSVRFKYEIIKPDTTIKDLKGMKSEETRFNDVLYEKHFKPNDLNDSGAINNIIKASESIDGYIVSPNEVFSFNGAVGRRTREKGYTNGPVYESGKQTRGIGGGICLVSSGLYNAALNTGMEIIERKPHVFNPGYVDAGLDATVVFGSIDFKFKNTLSNPIRIDTKFDGNSLRIRFLGVDEGISAKIRRNEYDLEKANTDYKYNNDLKKGEKRVIQNPKDGLKVEVTREIFKNGSRIKKENLGISEYKTSNKIVEISNEDKNEYDIIDLN